MSNNNVTPNIVGTTFADGNAVTVVQADAGQTRQYLFIQNLSTANNLYFRCDGTAATAGAGSRVLLPGGSANANDTVNNVPQGNVSLIGTSGQPYTVEYL